MRFAGMEIRLTSERALELGLWGNDLQVYLLLEAYPELTPGKLAEIWGIPRQTMYDRVKSLKCRGMLSGFQRKERTSPLSPLSPHTPYTPYIPHQKDKEMPVAIGEKDECIDNSSSIANVSTRENISIVNNKKNNRGIESEVTELFPEEAADIQEKNSPKSVQNSPKSVQNSPKSVQPQKTEYAPSVFLTEAERQKLADEMKEDLEGMLEYYSNYKIDKKYKNTSDYLSIKRWGISGYYEHKSKNDQAKRKAAKNDNSELLKRLDEEHDRAVKEEMEERERKRKAAEELEKRVATMSEYEKLYYEYRKTGLDKWDAKLKTDNTFPAPGRLEKAKSTPWQQSEFSFIREGFRK